MAFNFNVIARPYNADRNPLATPYLDAEGKVKYSTWVAPTQVSLYQQGFPADPFLLSDGERRIWEMMQLVEVFGKLFCKTNGGNLPPPVWFASQGEVDFTTGVMGTV